MSVDDKFSATICVQMCLSSVTLLVNHLDLNYFVQGLINLSDVTVPPITFAKVVVTFSSWTTSVIVLQRVNLLESFSTVHIITAASALQVLILIFVIFIDQ
jgi:hypothetical protein